MKSGIYIIKNLINNHSYIGSSINIKIRCRNHIWMLRNNRHHSIYLQNAWNKYGEKSFVFETLENCSVESLFEREEYYALLINPEYSIGAIGGGDNISKNSVVSKIKEKYISGKGTHLVKHGPNSSNWKGGKTFFTCPMCSKIVRTNGQKRPKTCMKCCDRKGSNGSFYGKKHTEEMKNKQRQRYLGRKPVNCNKIIIDGIIYESQRDAAKAIGVHELTIHNRIKKGIYTVIDPNSNLG